MLESILAANATFSSQRLLEALVSFDKLVILLILLPLLLILLSLFSLFHFLSLFENFIDNFAAFEQVLHVLFGFLGEIWHFAGRWWLSLGLFFTAYRRHLSLDLIDRALVQGLDKLGIDTLSLDTWWEGARASAINNMLRLPLLVNRSSLTGLLLCQARGHGVSVVGRLRSFHVDSMLLLFLQL